MIRLLKNFFTLSRNRHPARKYNYSIFVMVFILMAILVSCATETPVSEPTDFPSPVIVASSTPSPVVSGFSGDRAYEDVKFQVDLGPRIPGTPAHDQMVDWMVSELEEAGWQASVQEGESHGVPIRNVVAQRVGADSTQEWIILGAHFDTRSRADHDPDPARWGDPVPGANDGASGVAVLLELARVLPPDLDKNIWLVFFDAEDDGGIDDREWIMGSTYFVEQLTLDENAPLPDAAVVVDMIGDANLEVYLERNSDPILSGEIWGAAEKLGYQAAIIPIPRYRMLDDHIPFRKAGIPAVDMIDFDYPYWHTVSDTVDKVSAESLQMIGDTLLLWLMEP